MIFFRLSFENFPAFPLQMELIMPSDGLSRHLFMYDFSYMIIENWFVSVFSAKL